MPSLYSIDTPRSSTGFRRPLSLAAALLAGLLASGLLLAAFGARAALAAAAAGPVSYPGVAPCDGTLQACIDGLNDGDTIVIQPNTYITNELILSHALSLTGVSSATVILQAKPGQRVLYVPAYPLTTSVIISGLTIAGGQASDVDCDAGCGGGIFAVGALHLSHVTLFNNFALAEGGGLYTDSSSDLVVLSSVSVISNADGYGGGGIFASGPLSISGSFIAKNQCFGNSCDGGAVFSLSNVDVADSRFEDNISLGDGAAILADYQIALSGSRFQGNQCTDTDCEGGAVFGDDDMTVNDTQFLSNTSSSLGGGLLINGFGTVNGGLFQNNRCTAAGCGGGGLDAETGLLLSGTRFISNTAAGFAGALSTFTAAEVQNALFQGNSCTEAHCQGGAWGTYAAVTITATRFLNNHSQQGGALYTFAGGARLDNNLFAGNSAAENHGAALFFASPGRATLRHNTLTGPTAAGSSAVYVITGTVALTNTLITSHTVGIQQAGGLVSEDYSLFSGVGTPLVSVAGPGAHSHSGAAGFVNPAAGNYHLGPTSNALDAGVDAGVSVDFDGDTRPFGAGFDIGFDEALIRRVFLPLTRR